MDITRKVVVSGGICAVMLGGMVVKNMQIWDISYFLLLFLTFLKLKGI